MKQTTHRRGEGGYALVGIMTVMMFGLILTTAAAPKLKMESQREREEEMLWRGQQVSRALKAYSVVKGGFPTDLNDLVKGVDVGTKKIRFLRPSALCDPMTPCDPGSSNWRPVFPGDPLVKELLEAYVATREKGQMVLPPPPALLVQYAAMGGSGLKSGGLGLGLAGDQPAEGAPPPLADGSGNGDGLSDGKRKGPIIGIVSRRTDRMFRNYFGIEQYDKTLFFPEVNVMVSGFINPLVLGSALASPGGPDANCPQGGVFIDGKCWGMLTPGKCPPDQRDNCKP
jgi:type II secretory pathway pseudopilin PulG